MERFICWNKGDILDVFNTDADYTMDHIFASVHIPVPIKKKIGEYNSNNGKVSYSQEDFLKEVTDIRYKHLFVAVLGVAGSGKSHLVRWLKTRIPSIPSKQEVLLIPKSGTNLREILRLILKERKGFVFDDYRKRLEQTTQQLDARTGRILLLDKLAQQLQLLDYSFFEEKFDGIYTKELVENVRASLPDLLRDIYLRDQYWLRDNGVIDRLYSLALGNGNERERLEKRRQFDETDLPTKVNDLGKAAAAAKRFISRLIGGPTIRDIAVRLLNSVLNEAVRDLLVGNGNLVTLMEDVRRQLKDEGVTLILLIEDFSNMQGIDGAVLEAVITRATPENGLCSIRTILACTDGYYGNLPKTYTDRTDFTVWVEYDVRENVDYDAFVARYLNAVRVGTPKLKDAFTNFLHDGSGQEWQVPNHCLTCEYISPCHSSFGSYQGIGLYPFNTFSAKNLYRKLYPNSFTPRQFIGQTIKEVMHRFAPEIENANFPNQELVDTFSGGAIANLNAAQRSSIIRDLGESEGRKKIALIEFWSQGSVNTQIDEEVYKAFGLLHDQTPIPPTSQTPIPPTSQTPIPPTPNEEETLFNPNEVEGFRHLQDWSNGKPLPQETQRELRKALYTSIKEYINWDDFGLIPGNFFGDGPQYMFRPTYIYFLTPNDNKTENFQKSQLLLPLFENERLDSTQALQALVLYQDCGNWSFDHDGSYFLAFTKYLKRWSEYILKKVTTYSREDQKWDPKDALLQWLYFGGRLCGNIKNDDTLIDIWEKMHLPIQFNNLENRSTPFKRMCESIGNVIKALIEDLESQTLCPKGGSGDVKYFDIIKVVASLKRIRKNGKLIIKCPLTISARYSFLETLERIDTINALEVELAQYKTCLNKVTDALGQPEELKDNFKKIEDAFIKIQDNGFSHIINDQRYENVKKYFSKNPFYLSRSQANYIEVDLLAKDIGNNFPEIVSLVGNNEALMSMKECEEIVGFANRILSTFQHQLEQRLDNIKKSNEGGLSNSMVQIDENLKDLVELGNAMVSNH